MIRPISFTNRRGLTLRGRLAIPKRWSKAVVFCHGFPSSSRGGTAKRILRDLPREGFLVLVFDFSHNPISDGRFEDKRMSREVDDLKAAIDFVADNFSFQELIVIGHSTGAIDASLYAHRDKRIGKLILAGAVSDLRNAVRYDFTDEQVSDFWVKGRVVYHRPGHWVHRKRIKKAFYDEFFTLDIPRAIRKYRRPLLIIHGEQDEIPEREARALYKSANRPKKIVLIKGADHGFHKRAHWRRAVREMVRFINT